MPNDPKKPAATPVTTAPPAKRKPDESFIGHDAATVVDASLARMKRDHDELVKQRAAAKAKAEAEPGPADKTPPGEDEPDTGEREAYEPDADEPDDDEPDAGGRRDLDPDAKLSVADLEALAKVKLPARLRTFFEKEAAKFEGWFCPDLDLASSMPLRFLAGELGVYWDFASDGYFELPSTKLAPIAACGAGDGTFFIAVDLATPKLPVHFFDYEEGFKPVAGSFEEFLLLLREDQPDSDDDDDDDDDEDDEPRDSDDDDDDDADDDDAWGNKLGPGGQPVDRDGVEWDWVTSEGVGFNDTDGEEEMSFEKNGKTYFKPDWGNWEIRDWVGYWKKIFAIEAAQATSDEAWEAAIKKAGLRNAKHLERVKQTFLRHYAKEDEFKDAAIVARQEETREKMRAAVKPGALEPVEGVSLQLFAGIQAQRPSLDDSGFAKLLAKNKLDAAKFARVDKVWMARMSDQTDPTAAMAIATEYGKAFAGAGAGQFGASAQGASQSMGISDKVAGKNVKGGEPCTFERYVEIQTAQSCWAQQGKDVNALLKQTFNLTAVDFSNLSAFWGQKMSTDFKLMTEVYPALDQKFRAKYGG